MVVSCASKRAAIGAEDMKGSDHRMLVQASRNLKDEFERNWLDWSFGGVFWRAGEGQLSGGRSPPNKGAIFSRDVIRNSRKASWWSRWLRLYG